LDLHDYIESGIIESYLLGLASPEEEAQLDRMRFLHPELNTEIAMMEYRLQKLSEEGGITPPALVWNQLSKRITLEEPPKQQQRPPEGFTYVLQPRNYTMTISIWWRCAFVAGGILIMALIASTIYFYTKYHDMEQRLLRFYPTITNSQPSSH
jgi:hypothetical protein